MTQRKSTNDIEEATLTPPGSGHPKNSGRGQKADRPVKAERVAKAARPVKPERVSKKELKSQNRLRFLRKMPRGGLAIEIGVWRGEFSRGILDELKPAKLCLIDPWKNFEDHDTESFSGREAADKMEQIFSDVVGLYRAEIDAGTVEVMRQMSGTALPAFADESITFAYVDGDHSYEGVKADLAALMPKMAFGGVMAFDDYHLRGWWGDGVLRAIHEFIGQYPTGLRILTVIGSQIAIEKKAPLVTT